MKHCGALALALCAIVCIVAVQACPPIIGNCYIFPPNDEWNRPIDQDPVDFMSDCTLDHIASTMVTNLDINRGYSVAQLRLDAGVTASDGYGMVYNISTAPSPQMNRIYFNSSVADYQEQSDWFLANGTLVDGRVDGSLYSPAYFPFMTGMAIEGWRGSVGTEPEDGDRHGIVVDAHNCKLYEAWSVERNLGGSYTVANTAAFDMTKVTPQRPATWTSADAAGLPIFPGVLRYNEIEAGEINHALRYTIETVQKAYAHPATKGGTSENTLEAYYGARFRLKASFDISTYSADTQVLLTALKRYGLMLADQGSTAYISTENHPGFGDTLLDEINQGNFGDSKRIAFTKDNWEMVQAPGSITYRYSASPSCNGKTQNDNPFTPDFDPDCDAIPSTLPSPPFDIPQAPFTPTAPQTPIATNPTGGSPSAPSSPASSLSSYPHLLFLAIFGAVVTFAALAI